MVFSEKVRSAVRHFLFFLFVFALAFAYRHSALKDDIEQNQDAPWRIFWTEGAMHYHFADQVRRAGWDFYADLSGDERVLHPLVNNDFEDFTLGMELLPAALVNLGWVDNLTQGIFAATNIYFAMKFVLFALLLLLLTRSLSLSFVGFILYFVSFPAFSRSLSIVFIREDFAIPFLLGAVMLFISAFRGNSSCRMLLAGICALLSVLFWHLAGFILLVLFCLAVALMVLQHRVGEIPIPGFIASFVILVVGGIVFPVLRSGAFLFSPLMFSLVLFIGLYFFERKWKTRRSLALNCALLAVFTLIPILLSVTMVSERFAPVFSLLWAKTRFLGQMPEDPRQLDFLPRHYWYDRSFQSPSLYEWFAVFVHLVLAAGAVAAIGYWKHKRSVITVRLPVVLLLGIGVTLGLIAQRNMIAADLFIVTAFVLLMDSGWHRMAPRVKAFVVLLCLVLPFVHPGMLWRGFDDPIPGKRFESLVLWLKQVPSNRLAFAGPYADLPTILAFSNARITSHSKWENAEVRRRSEEFFAVMYEDINQLGQYMEKYGANAFVYNLGFLRPQLKYQGAYTGPVNRRKTSYFFADFSPDNDFGYYLLEFEPSSPYVVFGRGERLWPKTERVATIEDELREGSEK